MPYPQFPAYNPMQVQYQNPMNYYPQQIQQTSAVINGKIVENVENVKMFDIPMNGENFYFPKADGTEVYTKRWLPNGTTEINKYLKVTDVPEEPKFDFSEMQNNIIDKLDSISERIEKLEKGITTKSTRKES